MKFQDVSPRFSLCRVDASCRGCWFQPGNFESVRAISVGFAGSAGSAGSPVKLSYKTLGKTGLKVTSVGMGCMITSDPSVVARAADLGITYFDTARGYQHGNNERMVGAALGGKRKQVVLSTKTEARDKAGALAQLDTSLSELKTDFVDIWYLHGKSSPDEIHDDMIEALQLAKQQGKARFVGVSTHSNQPQLIPWMVQKGVFDVVLSAFNFSMDPAVEQAIDAAAKAGMGVVAMKVMAGGSRNQKLAQQGALLAALKWVTNHPSVATTVPSMTDMDQLDENLKAMAGALTADDHKLLAAHLELIQPEYCRMCGTLRRRLRAGPAGGRCAALPHLRRRIRRVRAGAGEIFAVDQRADLRALRRLRRVHGEVSLRRAGCKPHGSRPGVVRMRIAHLALVPILLAAGMSRAQEYLSCQLAPGWQQAEPIHQYTADNLYDYKDGGAEGYLIYGFAGMKSLNCKSGENTLTIDVSGDERCRRGVRAVCHQPRSSAAHRQDRDGRAGAAAERQLRQGKVLRRDRSRLRQSQHYSHCRATGTCQ